MASRSTAPPVGAVSASRRIGFHRIQMEVYGFNERALRHAERAGWVREGVRRKAYWRNDEWVDGILFGLVAEDLEQP